MTQELVEQLQAKGGWVDLSGRAKFALTGDDRVRYLNGQVTNDVRKASEVDAVYACVTDAKGRIAADIFVHSGAESLLVDADGALREALGVRLERYIVADAVELADVTDQWALWHVFGPAAVTVAGVASRRLGTVGVDLWLPAGATPPSANAPCLTEADFETYRIHCGIPRWPNELAGDVFPQEAGIEDRAISYSKGCYIGQEIISRIRSTGKMPRQLVQWRAALADVALEMGDSLWLDDREIGRITSIIRDPVSGHWMGLAFVRQGAVKVDSVLLAAKGTPSIGASIEISAFVN